MVIKIAEYFSPITERPMTDIETILCHPQLIMKSLKGYNFSRTF